MSKKIFKSCQPSTVKERFLYGKRQPSTSSGQSIIEVIVSIAIAAILAVSLISTLLVTQKTSNTAKNTTEATKLAQQYMEQIRIFRDRQGVDKLTNQNDYCILNTSNPDPEFWTISGPPCPDLVAIGTTSYTRSFTIEDQSENRVFVKVTVVWEESGGTRSVVNDSFLNII